MHCRIVDIKNKEVINIKDGCRLGCINDLEIDMCCAKIISIIIYGKPKCFGILGRQEDIVIRWEDIEIIGEDAVLVCFSCRCSKKKSYNPFKKFFCKKFN